MDDQIIEAIAKIQYLNFESKTEEIILNKDDQETIIKLLKQHALIRRVVNQVTIGG